MSLLTTIAVTIPGLLGHPDNVHSWSETGELTELIAARDPFQSPDDESNVLACGPVGRLSHVRFTMRLMSDGDAQEPWYAVNDEVILDIWETVNGEARWTPTCIGDSYNPSGTYSRVSQPWGTVK